MRGFGEFERAGNKRDVRRRQVVPEMLGELRDLGHGYARRTPGSGSRGATVAAVYSCGGMIGAVLFSISMPILPAAIPFIG